MKIAILYDVIYPFSIGGGEKINWELARRLSSNGYDVSLVTSQMWPGEATVTREGVTCVGVCRCRTSANQLGNRSFLQPILFAWGAFWFLRRHKFDVVVCCAFPYLSCFAAVLANIWKQTPVAIIWYEARGLRAWVGQAGLFVGCIAACLEWMCGKLSPFNQTISEFSADRMVRLLGIDRRTITVIHAGVDASALAAPTSHPKGKFLLVVNRLVKHKRTDVILGAFAAISSDFPDYTLLIVGTGVEQSALQHLAEDLDVYHRVRFVGSLPMADLYQAFRDAIVFILASEQEGFGIVVLEAMAAGTPVLVRRAPMSAAAAIVTDGADALLFDDARDLAEKLRDILVSSDLRARLTTGGMRTADSNDWDAVIVPQFQQWLRAINETTSRHPATR